jgi:hypothetical protein
MAPSILSGGCLSHDYSPGLNRDVRISNPENIFIAQAPAISSNIWELAKSLLGVEVQLLLMQLGKEPRSKW